MEALFRNKEDYSEDRGTLLLYYKDKWVVYDRRALLFSGNNEQDAIDYAMINHCYDAWITCVGNEA